MINRCKEVVPNKINLIGDLGNTNSETNWNEKKSVGNNRIPLVLERTSSCWFTTVRLNWASLFHPEGNVFDSAATKYMDKWLGKTKKEESSTFFPLGYNNILLFKNQIDINSETKKKCYYAIYKVKQLCKKITKFKHNYHLVPNT